MKVVKNKVAAPFRQAEFDIEYGIGISSQGCILDLGIEHGIVQKSGSFFSYGDERMGQGRNNVKGYLRENPEIATQIESKIYEAVGAVPASAPLGGRPVPAGAAEGPPDAEPPPRSKRPRTRSERVWTTDERAGSGHAARVQGVASASDTIAELRTYLERKRVEPDAIDNAVAELSQAGPSTKPLPPSA